MQFTQLATKWTFEYFPLKCDERLNQKTALSSSAHVLSIQQTPACPSPSIWHESWVLQETLKLSENEDLSIADMTRLVGNVYGRYWATMIYLHVSQSKSFFLLLLSLTRLFFADYLLNLPYTSSSVSLIYNTDWNLHNICTGIARDRKKHKQIKKNEKCSARRRNEKKQNKNIAPPRSALSYNYMQLSMLWFIMIFEQHYGD